MVDNQCLSHLTACFREIGDGRTVELDGAFRLRFTRGPNGEPLCHALQEWWHAR